MADIFISYARADRDRIEKLASALEGEGYSVWWDRELTGGEEFSKEIERELHAAKAVIVAWSKEGAASSWVRDEASLARNEQKLFPIRLDAENPPLGFQQFHTFDFTDWDGAPSDSAFASLVTSIEKRTGIDHGEPQPDAAAVEAPLQPAPAPNRTTILIAGGAALLVALIAVIFLSRPGGDETEPPDLAAVEEPSQPAVEAREPVAADGGVITLGVIPFVNMSSDPEQEHFADGLSEELLNWLANVEGLSVPGRTASFQFKGQVGDFSEIGKRLGVKYLLEGSVRRSADDIRITAQLIEAETGYHLWSETYDREFKDFFALQDEVAQRVVRELLGRIPESGAENPAAVGDVDPRAHELYLEGRALWSERRTISAFQKLRAAVQIDSDHWLAQAYLAVTGAYGAGNGFSVDTGGEELLSFIDDAMSEAISSRPRNADVLFARGFVLQNARRLSIGETPEGNAATADFYRQATRLDPRHAEALHGLARLVEDDEERVQLLRQVIEIEPGHHSANANLVSALIVLGRFERAKEQISSYKAMVPGTSTLLLSDELKILGDARAFYDAILQLDSDAPKIDPVFRRVAMALADLNQIDLANRMLRFSATLRGDEGFAYWVDSRADMIIGDYDALAEKTALAVAAEDSPDWVLSEHAASLIYVGRHQEALDLILSERPDLLDPDQRRLQVGESQSLMDVEAHTAALALERLGRDDDADPIWLALLPELEAPAYGGWRRHIGEAIAYANLDEPDKAFESLEAAYDDGFRFLYSYACQGCLAVDFVSPVGFFEPIYDDPRFGAFVEKIKRENAIIWDELNAEYQVEENLEAIFEETDSAE